MTEDDLDALAATLPFEKENVRRAAEYAEARGAAPEVFIRMAQRAGLAFSELNAAMADFIRVTE